MRTSLTITALLLLAACGGKSQDATMSADSPDPGASMGSSGMDSAADAAAPAIDTPSRSVSDPGEPVASTSKPGKP